MSDQIITLNESVLWLLGFVFTIALTLITWWARKIINDITKIMSILETTSITLVEFKKDLERLVHEMETEKHRATDHEARISRLELWRARVEGFLKDK